MNIKVSKYQEGLRLDVLLSVYLKSRSQAEKYLSQSYVRNHRGEVVHKASYKVRLGDTFVLNFPDPQISQPLIPYDLEVPIIFEDDAILVVDKPAQLVTHPGCGHKQDTLVNALIGKVNLLGGEDPLRPGIVHRLDRDVSGLMVLSKTKMAYQNLLKQFQSRSIRRIYRGWVIGDLPDCHLQNKEHKIESFIGRHPKDRKIFYSFLKQTANAKRAVTFYRVLKSYGKHLHHLECRLETGRTHQIRVHLSSLSLWLIGDLVYGRRVLKRKLNRAKRLSIKFFNHRIALYSAELKFFHPINGQELVFRLPEPKEMRKKIIELFNSSDKA